MKNLIKSEEDLLMLNITPLKTSSEQSIGGPFYIDNGKFHKLNESVDRTYSYEEIINHNRHRLGLDPGFIKAEILANKVEIIILFVYTLDNLEFIKNAMKEFGWSFSNIILSKLYVKKQ